MPAPTFAESSGGTRIAVHELGGPDDVAAPVLLFSHATGLHGLVWSPMAAPLTTRYRCVALDYRGHGMSALPSDGNLTWSGMADDAEAVLAMLSGSSDQIHGIGHSMGGAALVLAQARSTGCLQSLWLYEPVIVPPGEVTSPDGSNPLADGALRRRARFASFEEALANYAVKAPLNQLHPDALEAYVRGGFEREDGGEVRLRCLPETESAVFRQALDSGAWNVLPTLGLPVAVVTGQVQEFGPAAFGAGAAARLPHGTLVERPHLGHFGPLEAPAEMANDVAQWVAAAGRP